MSISILILTLNEEMNLAECLSTVQWSDDVIVLDSLSIDRTVAIAEAAGARVVQREFDNWSLHQNWALKNIPFKYEWVFYIDADERMSEELREELLHEARKEKNENVAYFCGRKNHFMGRWLSHVASPSYVLRFFKPKHVLFERLVNPAPIIDGSYNYLKSRLEHYVFSKGLTDWIEKHNRYSLLEAVETNKAYAMYRLSLRDLFASDPFQKRKILKNLSVRLPFRPWGRFLYLYIIKRGFLDGGPGLTYCILMSIYEYFIVLKAKELRHRDGGLPISG